MNRDTVIRTTLLGLLLCCLTGCIFVDVKVPLDTDLDRTQLGEKVGKSQLQSILWLFAWGDAGIQAAARDGKMEVMHHADREIFTVLNGLYYRQTTVVYGE